MAIRFVNEDTEWGITKIPHRKSQCLYKMVGNVLTPLAYFKDDQCAAEFNRLFDYMTNIIITFKEKRRGGDG